MSSLTNKNNRGSGQLTAIILLAVWLAAFGWAVLNWQNLLDWWKLRQYSAPAAVSQLASQDGMTPYGQKIFYVNHPSIDEKSAFSRSCPNNGGEQTIVLGCYRGGESGIFLLSVSDVRLSGVEQVTAAHEMLHGAYERLSAADRRHVDAMLLDYYRHGLQDQQVKATINAYKKSEPDALVDEMHSIFGTEVAQLPGGLEQYYRRYFTNRSQVVGFAAQYRSEFTSREATINTDDDRLASLKTQINNAEDDLKNKQHTINAQQSILLAQRNSGDVADYNAGVPGYNSLIDAYNAEVQYVRSLVDEYNQLVTERNAIAFEENQLYKELSGTPAPISR